MSMTRAALLIALIIPLGACQTTREHWPKVDENELTVVLAAGQFHTVRGLDEEPCLGEAGETSEGVIVDCFSGSPSVVTFDVREVLYGTLPGKSVPVFFHPPIGRPYEPPYGGGPLLVVLQSDGEHHFLTYLRGDIARLAPREWALAISEDGDASVLPCGASNLVRELKFAHPRPRRKLDPYELEDEELMTSLRNNPRVQIRGRYLYTLHGIPLRDVRELVDSLQPTLDTYQCHFARE
jgi:hypothetical protein